MDAITQPLQLAIVTPEQALPTSPATMRAPTLTLDPYTDEALLNPWPLYRELREMGSVVWLVRCGMFAITRYDAVVKALRD